MNHREKRLLLVFAGVAGALVLFFGFETYRSRMEVLRKETEEARMTVTNAELFLQMQDQFADEIEWLELNEPAPRTVQEVQPALEQLATREARSSGLTVLSPSFPPSDENVGYYGRARVRMTVTGSEAALYRWLHQLQSPEDFRTVVSMELTPLRDDDTQISCTVVLEQWFVPEPFSA